MRQFFFWCFPWDLEDEGIEVSLGRMAGDVGVDAVSVAATCRSVAEFRPRAVSGPRTLAFEAAAHFQPDSKCYVNTRIRPNTASWMKSRNPLDKIGRAAERQGLKLRAWVNCCAGQALASRYSLASCVDVFGDPIVTRLCPSNPEVREYVAALVEDVSANYPVETVELEEAHFGDGASLGRWRDMGVSPSQAESVLLSWCFCSSCRQRASDAGIEVASVVDSVNGHLDRMMRVEPATFDRFEGLLADDEDLAAYHKMRVDAVTSLLGSVRSRAKVRLTVHVDSLAPSTGVDVGALSSECDGFIMSYGSEGVVPHLKSAVKAAGGVEKVEAAHRCCPPAVRESSSLVAEVHRAVQAGHPGIGFFNYGLAPEPCMDWVRQAVRYARREIGA